MMVGTSEENMKSTQPFSALLAVNTTIAVTPPALVRAFCVERFSETHQVHPPLTDVLFGARAQPCILHIFRGRRLLRVIEFESPVVDFAGLPAKFVGQGLLCVVACRDGGLHALPFKDIFRDQDMGEGQRGRKDRRAAAPDAASHSEGCRGRRRKRDDMVDIYDDLAPTLVDPSTQSATPTSDVRDSGGCHDSWGGLVIRASRKCWEVCVHPGVRSVAVSSGWRAAAAGILDRTALYALADDVKLGDHAGDRVDVLEGLDGAAPTMVSVVWMSDNDALAGLADGDGKCFPLPREVFCAMFGVGLALSAPFPLATSEGDVSPPAVVLVGDSDGIVRWSPLRRCPGVVGGTLANLGQPIISILPFLCLEGGAMGLLMIGVAGAVLQIHLANLERSMEANQIDTVAEGSFRAARMPSDMLREVRVNLPFAVDSVCSVPGFLVHCHMGATFATPLTTGTAIQDKRLHSEKGGSRCITSNWGAALCPIRLPLPCDTVTVTSIQFMDPDEFSRRSSGCLAGSMSVPPPVAANVNNLTDARVRSKVNGGTDAAVGDTAMAVPSSTLILILSKRGKLRGFRSPRSMEELEGWTLDTGKGGVRVGGSAGVERRVKGQLQRLSAIGNQCSALSSESFRRDSEIRALKDASELLPALLWSRLEGSWRLGRKGHGNSFDWVRAGGISHKISMSADNEFLNRVSVGLPVNGVGQEIRVRLTVGLWLRGRGRGSLPHSWSGCEGRWCIAMSIMSTRGRPGEGEGQAWSVCTPVPLTALQRGKEWTSSSSFPLPSPQPVEVKLWLQLRFGNDAQDYSSSNRNAPNDGRHFHKDGGLSAASGLCIELGSKRFDLLDWGSPVMPFPGSDAAVRASALGRGECFCGPDMTIGDTFSRHEGAVAGKGFGNDPALARPFSSSWGTVCLRLACLTGQINSLLPLILGQEASALKNGAARGSQDGEAANAHASGGAQGLQHRGDVEETAGGVTWGRGYTEFALRVAGQVALVRARESSKAGAQIEVGEAGLRTVDLYVSCSHEVMAVLVREALLNRVLSLSMSEVGSEGFPASKGRRGGKEVLRRADAAAKSARGLHLIGEAVTEAGDVVQELTISRKREGVTGSGRREALSLMRRVGEIYQSLRNQQEEWAIL
ncbi:unnamed protein product [Choristocarpus tenellus]